MDNNQNEKGNFWWGVLGFFIPLVGLILYLMWKDTRKGDAKKAGIGAIVGSVASIVVPIIISGVFYLIIWPSIQSSLVDQTCKTYGTEYKAVRTEIGNTDQYNWCCCKDGSTNCSKDNPSCIIVVDEDNE